MHKSIRDVLDERIKQDTSWGGQTHDDKHSDEDWDEFIVEYAEANSPRTINLKFRQRMVAIAALALAAIESRDRKYP